MFSPTRSIWPNCRRPEKLDLEKRRDLADLVEEEGPALGFLESPQAVRAGSGEGAAAVAEELALGQGFGEGGDIHGHEAAAPGAAIMDEARDQLLARPALARQEDGGRARRGAGRQAHGRGHLPAPIDDSRRRRRGCGSVRGGEEGLVEQGGLFVEADEEALDILKRRRLDEVVVGPLLEEADRLAGVDVGRHHHDGYRRVERLYAMEHVEARAVEEAEIA